MRIAVEGCAHGELEKIYSTIQEVEKRDGKKVDLLLCCGDFQSTRNLADLKCMAVPDKYKDICSFYKYYSATQDTIAPVLTIFIGGNHEASNFLQVKYMAQCFCTRYSYVLNHVAIISLLIIVIWFLGIAVWWMGGSKCILLGIRRSS